MVKPQPESKERTQSRSPPRPRHLPLPTALPTCSRTLAVSSGKVIMSATQAATPAEKILTAMVGGGTSDAVCPTILTQRGLRRKGSGASVPEVEVLPGFSLLSGRAADQSSPTSGQWGRQAEGCSGRGGRWRGLCSGACLRSLEPRPATPCPLPPLMTYIASDRDRG